MENLEETEITREKHLVIAIKKDKKNITKERARVIAGTLLSAIGVLGITYFSPKLISQFAELDAFNLNSIFLENSVVAEFILSMAALSHGTGMANNGFYQADLEGQSLRCHQKELNEISKSRK